MLPSGNEASVESRLHPSSYSATEATGTQYMKVLFKAHFRVRVHLKDFIRLLHQPPTREAERLRFQLNYNHVEVNKKKVCWECLSYLIPFTQQSIAFSCQATKGILSDLK